MNKLFTVNPWIYFGEYVLEMRRKNQIGIRHFEDGADLTMSSIYYIQNSQVAPRLDNAYKILSVLGSNMSEFETYARKRIDKYESV